MERWFVIAVTAVFCLSALAIKPAIAANCASIQAKCAVEAGGKCDTQTGHWCYGVYKGENCGGSDAAFQARLARNGASPSQGRAAAAGRHGKCTSISAQCAVEIGGQCNVKTGFWCYGFYQGRNCGGTNRGGAFDACLSRKLGERK
jgi:hypothetical protein